MDVIDDPWERAHNEREWGRWPNEHLVRFAMRNYGEHPNRWSVRFLDMGCGAGASARFLSTEGFNVTAVDRSCSAVSRLDAWSDRHDVGIDTMVGDLESIEFGHGVFDCLVDVCSLQHVREPLPLLGRAAKWLKPGGRMFSLWAEESHDKEIAEAISGHCWRLSEADVAAHFAVFPEVDKQFSAYSDRGRVISHWVITARKAG